MLSSYLGLFAPNTSLDRFTNVQLPLGWDYLYILPVSFDAFMHCAIYKPKTSGCQPICLRSVFFSISSSSGIVEVLSLSTQKGLSAVQQSMIWRYVQQQQLVDSDVCV